MPRGLLVAARDPLGAESSIEYDEHDLLPTLATDPVGLEVERRHDLRVLQPEWSPTSTATRPSVTFSPAGLVTANYVDGKGGEGDDALPSMRIEYDLLAFAERGAAGVGAHDPAGVFHDTETDIPADRRDDDDRRGASTPTASAARCRPGARPRTSCSATPCSAAASPAADQATARPARVVGRVGPDGSPLNVVVSGWQVYDNKGRVVEKYEPFFSTGFGYVAPVDAAARPPGDHVLRPRGIRSER